MKSPGVAEFAANLREPHLTSTSGVTETDAPSAGGVPAPPVTYTWTQ